MVVVRICKSLLFFSFNHSFTHAHALKHSNTHAMTHAHTYARMHYIIPTCHHCSRSITVMCILSELSICIRLVLCAQLLCVVFCLVGHLVNKSDLVDRVVRRRASWWIPFSANFEFEMQPHHLICFKERYAMQGCHTSRRTRYD